MPPKSKFTKEQIIQTAVDVVSAKGIEALTAKELGFALGTSTMPIFTVFNSMQEVEDAVMDAIMNRFEEYAHKVADKKPVLKQVGLQMILFAKEEPKLYQLLFMSSARKAMTFEDMYNHLGIVADECLQIIEQEYDLGVSDAKSLFEHIWIHTFGIGALCATGACNFSFEQINKMLSQDFLAMLMLIKSGQSTV